jgi:hypothetical protein
LSQRSPLNPLKRKPSLPVRKTAVPLVVNVVAVAIVVVVEIVVVVDAVAEREELLAPLVRVLTLPIVLEKAVVDVAVLAVERAVVDAVVLVHSADVEVMSTLLLKRE